MTYIPLHHKYRPQVLTELVGQDGVRDSLSKAIAEDRVPKSLLFIGPRGTGKTSTARIFAKSLNCTAFNGPTLTPCLQCPSCTGIAEGRGVGVDELDAATNTGVDNIRELIKSIEYASGSRYRVVIIDEAHELSKTAQNALLKTIEEPPPGTIFILATTKMGDILETIRSRCMTFSFSRVKAQPLGQFLMNVLAKEGLTPDVDVERDALRVVIDLSQGCVRDALTALDQLLLFPPPVTEAHAQELLGVIGVKEMIDLHRILVSGTYVQLIDHLRKLSLQFHPEPIVSRMAQLYTDALLIQDVERYDAELHSHIGARWFPFVKEIANSFSRFQIHQVQLRITDTQRQIRENDSQARLLWLEVGLSELQLALQGHAVAPTELPVDVLIPKKPVAGIAPTAFPADQNLMAGAPLEVSPMALASSPVVPDIRFDESEVDMDDLEPPVLIAHDLEQVWKEVLGRLSGFEQGVLRNNAWLCELPGGKVVLMAKNDGIAKVAKTKLQNIVRATKEAGYEGIASQLSVAVKKADM